MWKPTDVVEVTNVSNENLILELESGPLRLDAGRSYRLTGSALQQSRIKVLLDAGKLKVEPYRR
jgi:hypothetical protein